MAPNIHLKLEKNTAECRQILGVDSNSTPKEIKQAYQAQVQLKFAETLCGYGNSLKALPKGEKISLVVKRGGEQVKSRYLDKVYIFNKSDVLKCVVDDIDAKSLLAKATQYSF